MEYFTKLQGRYPERDSKKYGIYAEAIVSANSIDGATTLVAGSEIFYRAQKSLTSHPAPQQLAITAPPRVLGGH